MRLSQRSDVFAKSVHAVLVAALSTALVGCGSTGAVGGHTAKEAAGQDVSGRITVFAASSLAGAFAELGNRFERDHPGTSIVFSFAASSTLAQQIQQGAPADLFASAASKNMQQVIGSRDVPSSRDFARNMAAIVVTPAKAAEVRSVTDLAKPGIKVAVCQSQVPCGAVARDLLTKNQVVVKPVTEGLDVKTTLSYVTSGEADAAVVYATDAMAAGNVVVAVPIPAERNASTSYSVGVLKRSANSSLADAFEAFVLSGPGSDVLQKAGFLGP